MVKKKSTETHEYVMTVSGGLVKHLGLQMYSGAVPAIAELVSNAWDAMAREVYIDLPLDRPIEESDEIIVTDDGHGMTYDECNEAYLVIGRDRRKNEGDYSRKFAGMKKRKLQSRKGIGKLAGFGIANDIEIRTVSENTICHFAMNYDAITRGKEFVSRDGYKPDILADDGKETTESPGTRVRLINLKITRSIPEDQFRRSMARRFTIMSDEFRVFVNGKRISKSELPFQFRYPNKEGKWERETLSNGHTIKWWAGFTKRPINDEDARGFVVYARGKLAQTPWFFDLSGGTWGQHGLQYMTGEVMADFLDQTDGQDLIATDRGTVRWEDPAAAALKDWGIKKIRKLLDDWATGRRKEKIRSPKVKQYLELAENLPERERRIFKSFVDRITSIPHVDVDQDGKEILDELVEFGYNALTNRSFIELIRQINAAAPEDKEKLFEVLNEWDILEAVATARVIKGRVEIIRKFRSMIEDKVKEKPDMHEYLKKYPWLIDPKWTPLSHEEQLDKLIKRQFNIKILKSKEGRKRLDFFCLGDKFNVAYVVELKRPGDAVGRKELDQLRDYVLFLRKRLQFSSTDDENRRQKVDGLLICTEIRKADELHAEEARKAGTIAIRTWENLLQMSEQLHGDFLKVVKERAPGDDPRIKELDEKEPSNKSKSQKKTQRHVKETRPKA